MANTRGKNGNSDRLLFLGAPKSLHPKTTREIKTKPKVSRRKEITRSEQK